MIPMLIETVVIAFVIGGILGAVTALHLNTPKRSVIPIEKRHQRKSK